MIGANVFGYPFQGDVYWYKEPTYSYGIKTTGAAAVSTTTMWVSEVVNVARIDITETKRPLRGISEPSICAFVSTTSDYSLHLEWIWEKTDVYSIVSCCVNRMSTGTFVNDIVPLSFVICTNEKMSAASQTFYYLKGAKCKNINIKGNINTEYVCSADFSVASFAASATKPSTGWKRPAALAGTYAFFNKAGGIVKKNTSVQLAWITDSIDVTINNHLTDMWSAGSPWKQDCVAGQMDVTGSADITLDLGGLTDYASLYTTMTNILINTNNGDVFDILTLTSAEWQGRTYEVNTGDAPMKTNAKFVAKKAVISST